MSKQFHVGDIVMPKYPKAIPSWIGLGPYEIQIVYDNDEVAIQPTKNPELGVYKILKIKNIRHMTKGDAVKEMLLEQEKG